MKVSPNNNPPTQEKKETASKKTHEEEMLEGWDMMLPWDQPGSGNSVQPVPPPGESLPPWLSPEPAEKTMAEPLVPLTDYFPELKLPTKTPSAQADPAAVASSVVLGFHPQEVKGTECPQCHSYFSVTWKGLQGESPSDSASNDPCRETKCPKCQCPFWVDWNLLETADPSKSEAQATSFRVAPEISSLESLVGKANIDPGSAFGIGVENHSAIPEEPATVDYQTLLKQLVSAHEMAPVAAPGQKPSSPLLEEPPPLGPVDEPITEAWATAFQKMDFPAKFADFSLPSTLDRDLPPPLDLGVISEIVPVDEEVTSEVLNIAEGSSRVLDDLIVSIDQESRDWVPEEETGHEWNVLTDVEVEEKHIIFTLGDTDFAVLLTSVLEVGQPQMVTPLPNVPAWMLGLSNLRGDIISIVDLRSFFGMEQATNLSNGRMLIVHSKEGDLTTGLMVDRIKEICRLPVSQFNTPASATRDSIHPYLRGVAENEGRSFALLDLDRLLLSSEMRQFETF